MACSTLVMQFALCLHPKPLNCLHIDFRVVRINEILRMYHNLMLINPIVNVVNVVVSSPSISYNYSSWKKRAQI